MMRILGIAQVRLAEFRKVCVEGVATTLKRNAVFHKGCYVTPTREAARFEKTYRGAGFPVIATNPDNHGDDDVEVNRQILARSPHEIEAVVVITADVIDYLDSLRCKRDEGIEIFIGAITLPDPRGGNPMLSVTSLDAISREGFHLIDLALARERLLLRPWVERERPIARKRISATFECSCGDAESDAHRMEIYEAISQFFLKHKIVEFVIQFEPARVTISTLIPDSRTIFLRFQLMIAQILFDYNIESGSTKMGD
ncbi:MAG: hypothetical protein HY007_02570 [Candidatus Sungbacteria bacterium]|nr:hypothetical protein [Candidatus Sungbacteria bacterium]